MGSSVDSLNYISVLNTANNLFQKKTGVDKSKEKKLDRATKKKTKTFLDSLIESDNSPLIIDDYGAKLEGLSPADKKKAIDDILSVLQDKVFSNGANLADNINADTINEYKKAVKTFVNFAVKHALDVKSVISGGLNPIKQKSYTIVKIIDQKVERLTQELLFNQIEKLQILERLDEIKGLLVNLTL